MKSKKIFAKLCLLAAIVLSSCSIHKNTYSNFDESVDFTKYKTYAWLNSNKSTPYFNDVIENNAKSYVDQEFKNRGYLVDTFKPDVLLELVLESEMKKNATQNYNPYNYSNFTYFNSPYNSQYNNNFYYGNPYFNHYPNYNYGTPYSYYPGYTITTNQYTKSTITLNVIEMVSNKLVWTGSAEKDIYDPSCLKKEIHPAVINILKLYPTKPIKKTKN